MPQTVVIVSKDKDFSQSLAEQVKRELAMACTVSENNEVTKALMAQMAVLVTTENEPARAGCPVIVVRQPPIKMRDILVQIEGMLQKPSETLELGQGFALQLRQKQLSHGDMSVDLTDKEIQLLQCLAAAGKKGVGKEQLLKDVWGIEAVLNTHTLETHIYRLRGKFKELGDEDRIIASEGGYGLK